MRASPRHPQHRHAGAALTIATFVGLAAPAGAQNPVGAAEFDAYATGKTLIYGTGGVPYGIEEYLRDRRVRWSFLDGDCVEGSWYPEGDAICFVYETRETPQCWYFFAESGGLRARPVEDPDGMELYEIQQSREPMQCRGPRIGV